MGEAAQECHKLRLPPCVGFEEDRAKLAPGGGQLDAQRAGCKLERFAAGDDPRQSRLGRAETKSLLQQLLARGWKIVQVVRVA